MDQDGVTDIVTNDLRGDIKIFYGGHDGQGNGNYLSTQTGICDANRYTRQQNHMQTVKRLGVKLRDDWLVTDQSLVHRKNMQLPDATTGDTEDVTGFDPDAPVQNTNESAYVGTDALSNAQSFNANISAYTATSSKDNAYVQNPTTDVPYYENSMTADQVMYLPISQLSGAAGSGDGVSIYKQYTDLNGGILLNNDKVLITTTILSLRNNNRLTYLDKLSGPRKIQKNENNEITSLLVTGTNANIIHAMTINQNIGSDYQLMLDNIILQSNETVSFSYVVSYQQPVLSTISVQDEDLSDQGKPLDGYPDIAIQTSDPCIKTRRVERNTHQSSQQFKAHQEVTDDIQQTANDYISGATADEQTQMNTTLQNISTTQPSNIQSLPGMSSLLENRSLKDLFTNGGMNINLNTNFIDQATAGVSKKIDEGLKGLCQ